MHTHGHTYTQRHTSTRAHMLGHTDAHRHIATHTHTDTHTPSSLATLTSSMSGMHSFAWQVHSWLEDSIWKSGKMFPQLASSHLDRGTHTGPAISAPRPSGALSRVRARDSVLSSHGSDGTAEGLRWASQTPSSWNRPRGWLKTWIPRLQPELVDPRVRAFQTPERRACVQEEGVWGQRRGDLLQGCAPQAVQSVGGGLSSWEGADRKLRLIHLFDMATCPCGVGEDS